MSTSTFACSICLRDSPKEPVLTCCGHVFCWRCIYRWLAKKRACPLCNGYLSSSSDITPIYFSSSGADHDPAAAAHDQLAAGPAIKDEDDDEADLPAIPPRPPAHRRHNCGADGSTSAEIRRPAYNSEADDSTQYHHHASGQQQTFMLRPVVMDIPAQMLQAPIAAHQLYYMQAAWPAPILENQHHHTDVNVHRASRMVLPGRAFAVRQNPISSAQ
ncbi:hypothetical protein L7F22_056773 [Adiantum nelumboides]|nr:hypothetical protein [Adiantum nelumboides]